jgi:hypothetical protein
MQEKETGEKKCMVGGTLYEIAELDYEDAVADENGVIDLTSDTYPVPGPSSGPSAAMPPPPPKREPAHWETTGLSTPVTPPRPPGANGSIPTSSNPYPLPPPPPGFKWRSLLELPDTDITFPVEVIAGRYYPDLVTTSPFLRPLLDKALQTQPGTGDPEVDHIRALAGLLVGEYNSMDCVRCINEGRQEMFREADRCARDMLFSHWTGKLANGQLGFKEEPMEID